MEYFKTPEEMTREEFIQYRVEWICCTSVSDGRQSLKNESDIEVVKAALAYEQNHSRRATLLKSLISKLNQLKGGGNG